MLTVSAASDKRSLVFTERGGNPELWFRLVIRERFSPELEKKTDVPARKVRGVTEDKQANPQHPGEQRGGCRGGLDRGAGTCDGESAAVRLWLLFKALKLARFPGASGCPRENSTIRTLEKDGLCGLAEDKELEEEGGWQPWAGTGGKGHSRIRGALHACHPLTDVMVSGGLGRGPLVAVCRAREGRP
uniref:Uncharacterized protein n=1 Tax=Rangifer tarandus platyrhynchus TaxID=3082113 RepID=A0ACB0DZQ4_RANTA|nr:unnamed protein product [Rangifer tarandus platyrhynchus]